MLERDVDGTLQWSFRGALVAWSVVGVLVVVSAAVMLGYLPVGREGSSRVQSAVEGSGGNLALHSGGEGSVSAAGDVVTSGRYPVSSEGKLLRPVEAPVPVAPPLPGAAMVESPEGMEAFARYVHDVMAYAWTSGDTTQIERLSLESCSWCSQNVQKINTLYASDGWVEAMQLTVSGAGLAQPIEGYERHWEITLQVEQSPVTIYKDDRLYEVDAFVDTLLLQARYIDGQWRIVEVGVQP